ncbi:MAG TPA: ABC transporter permease [Acidimicrobiia bacterium]|nr:ABC transporter permease [Acidimicrobiia bacterium]
MIGYIARRLLALIPLLFIISFVVFGMTLLIPGDPAVTIAGGTHAQPADVARVRHELHFDRPLLVRYGYWLRDTLHGDLGVSYLHNTRVADEIARRFPVTLSMALGALALTILIGVPAGIIAGTKPGSLRDRTTTLGSSVGIAMPDFWVAMLLVVIFAVRLGVLPAQGYVAPEQSLTGWARHLALPWLAMGLAGAAAFSRQLRGSMIDALEQDYIRTAKAKGATRRRIVLKHALKNASFIPITVLGLQFAYMLGGTVVLENIFSLNGIGRYYFTALVEKDIPVIQGVTLFVAITFVVINLAIDIAYGFLNPKVRLS